MGKLAEKRMEMALTQRQLAERSGVPQQTISAIESGERKSPGILTAIKLARALECTVMDIDWETEGDQK